MQTPASYTLLGTALTLGSLAVVGLGGTSGWYLWETAFHDRTQPFVAVAANCSSKLSESDILLHKVGQNLILKQETNTNVVSVTGVLTGQGVRKETNIYFRLFSEKTCTANLSAPLQLDEKIFQSSVDNLAYVDLNIAGFRLDGTDKNIIGNVIAIQTPARMLLGCCTITKLPGGGVTSRRQDRAASRADDVTMT